MGHTSLYYLVYKEQCADQHHRKTTEVLRLIGVSLSARHKFRTLKTNGVGFVLSNLRSEVSPRSMRFYFSLHIFSHHETSIAAGTY